MEINYQETSNDLLTRIRIHETYGARNIDQWNTEVLRPSAGMKILDGTPSFAPAPLAACQSTSSDNVCPAVIDTQLLLAYVPSSWRAVGRNLDLQAQPVRIVDTYLEVCAIVRISNMESRDVIIAACFGKVVEVVKAVGHYSTLFQHDRLYDAWKKSRPSLRPK